MAWCQALAVAMAPKPLSISSRLASFNHAASSVPLRGRGSQQDNRHRSLCESAKDLLYMHLGRAMKDCRERRNFP